MIKIIFDILQIYLFVHLTLIISLFQKLLLLLNIRERMEQCRMQLQGLMNHHKDKLSNNNADE